MKTGAINLKSIIIGVIILLVGVLTVLLIGNVKTFMTGAAAGAEPTSVLATPGDDGKSATITWTTEKPVQAVVEYGANAASLLLRAPESEATTDHRVVMTPLKSNQNYFFRIKVGEEIFDNGGIPYSFKTKLSTESITPVAEEVTPTISVAPTSTVSTVSGTGKCSSGVDYNGDGVANSVDYLKCLKEGSGGSMVTPVVSPTVAGGCKSGVDYDGNGTVNSLDMIKCLQTKK